MKTLSERLRYVAPPSVVESGVENTIPDLQRILQLPRREPYICERDASGNYPARTQALIEVETAKFGRGQRISCGCRPRKLVLGHDGALTVFRTLPEEMTPEPPVRTTVAAFVADNNTLAERDIVDKAVAMVPGQEIELPAADKDGHPCITELSPAQAWFLREAAQEGGAVGFLGVGTGKSLIFLLAPLLFSDARLAVLLIEPKQRQHYRSQYLRLREHFRVSSISSDAINAIVPGTVPVHLVSYSILSRTENSDMLDRLKPDILLGDEFHRAAGTSAINKRVKRYARTCIRERQERISQGLPVRARALRLLCGSGTLEVESINDTQMICAFALGTTSPLPLDTNEAEAWSNVIDLSYKPDRKSATARALHRHFGKGFVAENAPVEELLFAPPEKDLREGFQKWRSQTPGIITATSSDVNAAHYFSELKSPEMPQVVKEALKNVRVDWKRPDGEELVEIVQKLACAKNVSCGFYPYWAFPKHPCACPSDRTSTRSLNWCPNCVLIDDWYARRKVFSKAKRSRLQRGEIQLDTEKLCEDAARRAWALPDIGIEVFCATCSEANKEVHWPCTEPGHLPAWREESWPAWSEIEHKVEYEERVKWLGHDSLESQNPDTHPGYYLARYLADWGRKHKGVIWFQSVPLGRKIAELGELPYFNGGPGGEERLRAEKGKRSIVCSISAHGQGTDGLQEIFDTQVFAEVPSSNAKKTGLEQVLGRIHRRGQKSPEVQTFVVMPSTEFRDSLRKAIQKAEYNWQMTKNLPKILSADLDIDDL